MKRKGFDITKVDGPLVVAGRVVDEAFSVARSDGTPLGVVATADEVELLVTNDREAQAE